jgi:hypothetical protein
MGKIHLLSAQTGMEALQAIFPSGALFCVFRGIPWQHPSDELLSECRPGADVGAVLELLFTVRTDLEVLGAWTWLRFHGGCTRCERSCHTTKPALIGRMSEMGPRCQRFRLHVVAGAIWFGAGRAAIPWCHK